MLEMFDVSKVYANSDEQTFALRNVSLTVHDGEFIAVMGKSGSGKSTLLHILGCMDIPTEGRYCLDGRDVSEYRRNKLSRLRKEKISFVFQNFALMDRYSAYENIELPLLNSKISKKERKKRIMEIAHKLEIESQLNKFPGEMSGGQQQRVALARAFVSNADIILADEPTGALDHATGMEIMRMLKQYNKAGHTIILVTHDSEVAGFADRIVYIEDGRLKDEIK